MSDQSGALPTGTLKKRANPSSGWIVMLLSGFLAFVIFLYASMQGAQTFEVLALDRTYQTGEAVDPSQFKRVEVNMPRQALERLILLEEADNFNGWIATGPMEANDIVNKSMLRAPGAPSRMRAMAISREQSSAVGGALAVGDRIDIVSRVPGRSLVAVNLEVLSAGVPGGGGIRGGGGDYTLVVAVTPAQADRIADELADSQFDIIRSTGARTAAEYDAQLCDLLLEGLADPAASLDIPECGAEPAPAPPAVATAPTAATSEKK